MAQSHPGSALEGLAVACTAMISLVVCTYILITLALLCESGARDAQRPVRR